jgi:hypothetical protein
VLDAVFGVALEDAVLKDFEAMLLAALYIEAMLLGVFLY